MTNIFGLVKFRRFFFCLNAVFVSRLTNFAITVLVFDLRQSMHVNIIFLRVLLKIVYLEMVYFLSYLLDFLCGPRHLSLLHNIY